VRVGEWSAQKRASAPDARAQCVRGAVRVKEMMPCKESACRKRRYSSVPMLCAGVLLMRYATNMSCRWCQSARRDNLPIDIPEGMSTYVQITYAKFRRPREPSIVLCTQKAQHGVLVVRPGAVGLIRWEPPDGQADKGVV